MFDKRRLDTAGAMGAGVLGMPCPDDIGPKNIEWEYISLDFDGVPSVAKCRKILKAGKGLDGNGYYGLPRAWPEGNDKFAVDCLQYRNRTVEKHSLTLNQAIEEFRDLGYRCGG